MKSMIRLTLLFIVITAVASSCKKSVPAQTKYIPKDAVFVFDLNWKSLSDKAAGGNINWDSLYHSIADEKADSDIKEARKMLGDFMRSGIDTTKDVFFFMKMGGSIMAGQQVSGGAIGAMKDASAFEAFIKKQPGAGDIMKESKYSYIKLPNNIFVGWNSDVVILAGTQQQAYAYNPDSSAAPRADAGGASQLTALFALKEEESVASIPEFRDLMAEKGDMLFWSNSSSAFSSVPFLGMTKVADLFKDNYGAGVINFEDGKVTGNFKSYIGKDLAAILDKNKGSDINMDLVTQFPSPVQGYLALSFNPQIIADIIKYGGFESTVKQFMEKSGFTLEEALKIFKGDFAVVFGGIDYEEMSYSIGEETFTTKKPSAKVLFNATIGDKATYDKVMAKLGEMGEMEMVNGQYVPKGLNGIAWTMNGKNLIIASDSALMQQYLAGKGNAGLPANITDQSKGKAMAFYIDINKIIDVFAKDTAGLALAKSAQATFDHSIATTDGFNGKFMESKMELKMVNDKENSLVSLVKFIAAASQEAIKMQHKYDHAMDGMDMQMEDIPQVDSVEPAVPKSE